ncbi:hypothetical protein [Novosphingobium sp. FSW06-99]|uniref:hypothetical protein n=1 Tax=Novosphingobium sp. FSW06-99 TaxID=1739113 RepID=UPI0012E35866|nr:hypothetical protein [Novosphingobium sp. FSW06-99]
MLCHALAASGSALALVALVATTAPQCVWAATERSSALAQVAGNSAVEVRCATGGAGAGYRCLEGQPLPPLATMIWIYPVCTDALTDGCLDRVEAVILSARGHRATRRQRPD